MSSSTISPVTTFPACWIRKDVNCGFFKTKQQVICYLMLWKESSRLSYHNGVVRELSTDCFDKLHKMLRISIGHIQTDVLNEWNGFQNAAQFLQICLPTAWARSHMLGIWEMMYICSQESIQKTDRTLSTVLDRRQSLTWHDWVFQSHCHLIHFYLTSRHSGWLDANVFHSSRV